MKSRGFGGDQMRAAGLELTVHYEKMAFMGFWEVLTNLGTIRRRLRQCEQDILFFQPDVLILIDYAGFNLKIAAFAKKHGIPVIYYISPKIWAWNQRRGWKMKRLTDRVLSILPFEPEFYQKFNMDVPYVGNPVLDAVRDYEPLTTDLPSGDSPRVALLPGSRLQEIRRILPLMEQLAARHPDWQFMLATVDNLPEQEYSGMLRYENVTNWEGRTYDLLSHARAAVVTSGTATLETALFRVPQVVVYKTSGLSYSIAKRLIKVPFISLVNLVAEKEVVPELIQGEASADRADRELKDMLENESCRQQVLNDYDHMIALLDTGRASENAAAEVVKFLKR